jgi:NAD(P)-dependent dehydrogenase (short-subunit alcohol dehydrogenase family)
MRFSAKRAAVIGMADIGRATALQLAREGADLTIVDDVKDRLDQVASEVNALGRSVETFPADLADHDSMLRIGTLYGQRHDRLDVLVNYQAAYDWQTSIEGIDLAQWERVLSINLTSVLASTKAFLPYLKASGAAAVVNVATIDGLFGNPRVPAYSASKGALIPLTHIMAHEFAPYGIRVNCIARCGTSVRGPAGQSADEGYARQLAASTPLKRLGDPAETASVITFLASAEASFVTGATVTVDGGRTIITPGTA